MFVTDVHGDSWADIVVANSGNNSFGVLLNMRNGTFGARTTYATGTRPVSVFVTDIDANSLPDIIVVNSVENNVGILLSVVC